jgi:hypothetical protein
MMVGGYILFKTKYFILPTNGLQPNNCLRAGLFCSVSLTKRKIGANSAK